MKRLAGAALVIAVLVGAVLFAAGNATERVTLDLGFTAVYRVPLTFVVFGALFVGMLVMVVVGIESDLKVRRILRDRLREEDQEERSRHDRYQRDLFREDDDEP